MKGETQVKLVFVRHRSHHQKWLAVLSTDVNLSDEEIIRIYGYRWEIEVLLILDIIQTNEKEIVLNVEQLKNK